MIVVLPEVQVLIADLPVAEPVALGEAEPAHQLEGLANEVFLQRDALVGQALVQLSGGRVTLDRQEGLQNLQAILEPIDALLTKSILNCSFSWLCNVFISFFQDGKGKSPQAAVNAPAMGRLPPGVPTTDSFQ